MRSNEGLPPAFLERLARIVPGDTDAAVGAHTRIGFRVNTLAAAIDDVVTRLGLEVRPIGWFPAGFTVAASDREALLTSESFARGDIWVQNPSSMVPPVVLDPAPGDRALDLAAAPGSKTLQLAAMMGPEADIAAVEVVRSRFYRLKRNLTGHRAAFVKTFNRDGTKVWRYRPDHFDRVLLDAPCSTEGRMRADDPETHKHWSVRKVRTMAGKQRRLLESAIRCVRPGGVVVYSTCSFAPEENEAVVQHALDVFGDTVEVEPVELDLPTRTDPLAEWEGQRFAPQVGRAMRVLPDGTYEAFFVCRLKRVE